MLNKIDETTNGTKNILFTYTVWIFYVILLVSLSTSFVRYIAPQAIGSGIPEMKTILRGVVLKEYLTFRTLISKMVYINIFIF